jgi:hypothetical protein
VRALLGRPAAQAFGRRCELGDLLLLGYVIVIARQYFWWGVHANPLAWILAVAVGSAVWSAYVATKTAAREARACLPFALFVVGPSVFAYLLRAPLPDLSFDVLNYRIMHGDRALRGFVYGPGDFFPTPAPYDPAPDMVTAIARAALGYRLGTIVNLFALLWTGSILERWLRGTIANGWLRSLSVLVILACEHLFFEINTYMVDVLALPLLLEAARLALSSVADEHRVAQTTRVAFLLGLAVAFKLTNLVVALPIVLITASRFLIEHQAARPAKDLGLASLFASAAFLLPVLPFSIYLQQQTGSPVYPILNGIFKSPYWPANSIWDPRWGPAGPWETLVWPIKTFFQPERLSELSLYSGRLSFGVIAIVVALIFSWRDAQLRRLCFVALAGIGLWSATTGYSRYALLLEVLTGLITVVFVSQLMQQRRMQPLAIAMLCVLATQSAVACQYVARTEWSRRPTFLDAADIWKRESRYLLRDRSLRSFISKRDRKQFDGVEVWLESSMKTTAFQIVLNKRAPVIGLRSFEIFSSREGRASFADAIERAAGKRMFTLCFTDDLRAALACVTSRGLQPGEQTPITVPFFSPHQGLPMTLIEVSGAEQAAAAARATP